MATWTTLKAAIQAVIKQNGNQEITGDLLQDVLVNMVEGLGLNATFAGVASTSTSPGAPDGPVFWLASGPGTYSNFAGAVVEDGYLGVLIWDGSAWSLKTVDIDSEVYSALTYLSIKDWPYRQVFYHNTENTAVGDTVSLIPTNNNNPSWYSILLELNEGDTVKFTNLAPTGPSIPSSYYALLVDRTGKVLDIITKTYNLSYTAAEHGFFMTSSYGSTRVTVNNSLATVIHAVAAAIARIADWVNTNLSTDVTSLSTEFESYKKIGTAKWQWTSNYFWPSREGNVAVGDTYNITKPQSYTGTGCAGLFRLFKGQTIQIAHTGSGTNWGSAFYIIFTDLDGVILELRERIGDEIMEYTATQDCYACISCLSSSAYVIISDTSLALMHFQYEPRISALEETVSAIDVLDESVKINVPVYLDCPIGRQTDLFLDGFIGEPDCNKSYPLIVKTDSAENIYTIGTNQLRYTPSKVEEISVKFTKYKDRDLTVKDTEETLIFRAIERNIGNGQTFNICFIGDSLLDSKWTTPEAYRLLAEDGDCVINQIGTIVTTKDGVDYRNEAYGGWSWSAYVNPAYETELCNNRYNNFMYDGELNFQKYMQKYFPEHAEHGFDMFFAALGTNDITQGSSISSSSSLNTVINNAKKFIDAFMSEETGYPNCKFYVGLIGVGAPAFVSTRYSSVVFKRDAMDLNRLFIDTFDNGKYHPNVSCVMHGAFIDRYDGFPYVESAVNDYTDRITRRWTNGVHPADQGYKQWGRGFYNKIRGAIAGYL